MGILKLSDFWLSRVPTKTKAGQTLEQHLFSLLLSRGTLKLSNFWLSRVPTKTKARQTTDQHLFPLLFIRGTLKLSNFWWSRVPRKTNAKNIGSNPVFVAAHQGHLEVVRLLVESGANKDLARSQQAGYRQAGGKREEENSWTNTVISFSFDTTWNQMEWMKVNARRNEMNQGNAWNEWNVMN